MRNNKKEEWQARIALNTKKKIKRTKTYTLLFISHKTQSPINETRAECGHINFPHLLLHLCHNQYFRIEKLVLIDIPSHCRSAEHSSRRTIKTANEEFSFALENLKDIFVVCLFDGFHNQIASLGQATEENESLR